MLKIMLSPSSYGWAVSLTKYEGEKLIAGFTLNTFDTESEQREYAQDLASMTGFELEED